MIPKVRKAVFPAAGLGTRFLPATKAQPKEMLPLVDKPLIQYGVEEAIKSGKKFKTVIGEISYDKKGDVTRLDYVMYVWKKNPEGKITYTEIK